MFSEIESAISRDTGLPPLWVHNVLLRAPFSYKVYQIPKRNGGQRVIAQPSRKTKALQYWVIKNVLSGLMVSDHASAYVKGRGIRQNAEAHKRSKYLAKFDFQDFFPSIKGQDLARILATSELGLSERDIKDVLRICFRKEPRSPEYFLSIGAPSSPLISNIVMHEFDQEISRACQELRITYTRYADDLTFSTENRGILFELPELIERILRDIPGPSLTLHAQKTVFASKKHQRKVTGLVLTNDGRVSLGRARKRAIKAMMHQFALGRMADHEVPRLRGLVSFAHDVEPAFVRALHVKYGAAAMQRLKA